MRKPGRGGEGRGSCRTEAGVRRHEIVDCQVRGLKKVQAHGGVDIKCDGCKGKRGTCSKQW